MERSFEFLSDEFDDPNEPGACLSFAVTVQVTATAEDFDWSVVEIYCPSTGTVHSLDHFSPDERKLINKKAAALASDSADEAYRDHLDQMGDTAHDRTKEEV